MVGIPVGLKFSPVDPSEQNKLSLSSEIGDQIEYCFIKEIQWMMYNEKDTVE